MAREFVDTNILVYAFSQDPRSATAEAVLRRQCDTSVQTLNEFVNVARRKLKHDWDEISKSLTAIKTVCRAIHPISIELHESAVLLSKKYGFAFFDALLIASALEANCDIFYSEDMHHDMLVEGRMRISNPFGS